MSVRPVATPGEKYTQNPNHALADAFAASVANSGLLVTCQPVSITQCFQKVADAAYLYDFGRAQVEAKC